MYFGISASFIKNNLSNVAVSTICERHVFGILFDLSYNLLCKDIKSLLVEMFPQMFP